MTKTGLSPHFYRRRQAKGFTGYTLLEIMVSVSLMLIIMYAVAAIFGRVGTIINETQSTMVMANNLRNVCKRLQTDLQRVSVPLAPPRNSMNNEGYFCYIEGLGTSFARIRDIDINASSTIAGDFSSADIAWDSDRSKGTNIAVDTTVGDMDDILMFTAKAPAGEYFRGRFLAPTYDGAGNINGCQEVMKESEYAEIIWFLRGTTLYRRTLLILPQEELQKGLDGLAVQLANGDAIEQAKLVPIYQSVNGTNLNRSVSAVELGYGFFRYFDVSVHLDYYDNDFTFLRGVAANSANRIKRVVANTLGDLSNRKNRYGYWNSVCGSNITSMHGQNGAWYWLRLPTLQESATIRHRNTDNTANYLNSFRAGEPFGYDNNSYTSDWLGWRQTLNADGSRARSDVDGFSAAILPIMPTPDGPSSFITYPFIDFWNAPNCWQQVNFESGDLAYAMDNADQILDQDVMLANVLSFDVKAWDEDTNQYVGLGSNFKTGKNFAAGGIQGRNVFNNFKYDFKTIGEYKPYKYNTAGTVTVADYANLTFLPAVYDTWTEQYQVEWAQKWEEDYWKLKGGTTTYNNDDKETMRSTREEMLKMTTGGEISSARLIDFPPPYDRPLKAVQIEIRVFDPRSRNIRNMTIPVEFTNW